MSRRDDIVDAAQRLVEQEGIDALSMRRLAETLDIQAPSLYKHLRGKDEVLGALQERALVSMREALDAAGTGIRPLARAYRAWARASPQMYRVATQIPLQRDRIGAGVEDAAARPVVDAVGGDIDRARALWALAHGMIDLELSQRFPPDADLDAVWNAAVALFEPTPSHDGAAHT